MNGDDNVLKKHAITLLHDEMFRKQMGKDAKQLLHDLFSVESAADKILNNIKQ